jgi:hypothetical protein
VHGVCESGGCVCEAGWRGPRCDVQNCDPRCSEHGMCSNGTCLCTNGWNGKHCTLEGKKKIFFFWILDVFTGSTDPYPQGYGSGPDPAIFFSGFRMPTKNNYFWHFLLISYCWYVHQSSKRVSHKTVDIKVFQSFFCLLVWMDHGSIRIRSRSQILIRIGRNN